MNYDTKMRVMQTIEVTLAVPLAVIHLAAILYGISWFFAFPIIAPFIIASSGGGFIIPFLAINVGGIACWSITAVDFDVDRILASALAQITVFAMAFGFYKYDVL